MGVDITGWVEVEKSYEWERGTAWEWYGVVKIDHLVHRSYGMFGGIFGWHEGYGFKSVVGERGKPEHMSEEFFLECEGYRGEVHPTWVLWSELAGVDWNGEGDDYLEEATEKIVAGPGPGRRLIRLSDYLNGGWVILLDIMERLAQEYGPEHVRLSVFFDG